MSVVTNIILTAQLEETGIADLNRLIKAEKPGNAFKQVDDYCGGTKAFEAEVWLAAFNFMNMPSFAALVRAVHWDYPESLRFFVQQQEEEYFSPFDWRLTAAPESDKVNL